MRFGIEQQDSVDPRPDQDLHSDKELQVLTEVESTSDITQRQLAQRVGIALGLTNSLLRSLIKKGYIRAHKASWKRWAYALTPEGASFKLRLIVEYVNRFLDHYQKIRQTLREQLEPLALNEESRVAIVGTGEFAELVFLGLKELGLDEIDVFSSDPESMHRFLGMPVRDLNDLLFRDYDRVLVASLADPPTDDLARALNGDQNPDKLVTFFPDARTEGQI
jgi:DNA-binding MarR family transcriptional regulator